MEQDYEKNYNEYREQSEQQIHTRAGQADLNGKEEYVAVRKNDNSDMITNKTNTGRELDYVSALDEAKAGNIAHIDVFHKYESDIIRSEPDGIKENNLDQLASF